MFKDQGYLNSMERWEAKYESADGQQATCSRTLFVPGAIVVCSLGSAKSTKDCASFESESLYHKGDKGDEDLFVVSDDDDTVSINRLIYRIAPNFRGSKFL